MTRTTQKTTDANTDAPTTNNDDGVTLTTPDTPRIELPRTINRFTATHPGSTSSKQRYTAGNGDTVRIQHTDPRYDYDDNRPARTITVTTIDADGNECYTTTIEYSDGSPLDVSDVEEKIETEVWEFGRYESEEHHAATYAVKQLGETHRDALSGDKYASQPGTLYHSLSHEPHYSVAIPDDNGDGRGSRFARTPTTYVPNTRFTIHHSAPTGAWYSGSVTVAFNHTAPARDAIVEQGTVYGVDVYFDVRDMKPVDERDGEHDTHDQHRVTVLSLDADETVSVSEFIETVEEAIEAFTDRAEPLDSDRRERIIEEADRRLNEETGEYEQQTRLTGY